MLHFLTICDFQRLRSAFIMTVLLGLASTVDDGSELDAEEQQYALQNDQQRAGSEGQIMVQAAAISALGVLVLFPSLREVRCKFL